MTDPLQDVTILIPGPGEPDEPRKVVDHAEYCVVLRHASGVDHKSWHRYSDFRKLLSEVRSKAPGVPPAPPKKFFGNQLAPELLASRAAQLQLCLRSAAVAPELKHSKQLTSLFDKFAGVTALKAERERVAKAEEDEKQRKEQQERDAADAEAARRAAERAQSRRDLFRDDLSDDGSSPRAAPPKKGPPAVAQAKSEEDGEEDDGAAAGAAEAAQRAAGGERLIAAKLSGLAAQEASQRAEAEEDEGERRGELAEREERGREKAERKADKRAQKEFEERQQREEEERIAAELREAEREAEERRERKEAKRRAKQQAAQQAADEAEAQRAREEAEEARAREAELEAARKLEEETARAAEEKRARKEAKRKAREEQQSAEVSGEPATLEEPAAAPVRKRGSGRWDLRPQSETPEETERRQLASWVKWVNVELRRKEMDAQVTPEGILQELSDGVVLIKLLHAVTSVALPKYNKKAKMDAARLDNLGIAWDMLRAAGIRVGSIGPGDVLCAHKDPATGRKQVLALLWCVIYDVSVNRAADGEGPQGKEGLLLWAKRACEGYDGAAFERFGRGWNTGRSLAALVDRFGPSAGSHAAYDDMISAESPGKCIAEALSRAQAFGVEPICGPEDFLAEDEKVVMAYVAEFFNVAGRQQQESAARRRLAKFYERQRALADLREGYLAHAREVVEFADQQGDLLGGKRKAGAAKSATLLAARGELLAARAFRERELADKRHAAEAAERLHSRLQATLRANQRPPYAPPGGLDPSAVAAKLEGVDKASAAWLAAAKESYTRQLETVSKRYSAAAAAVQKATAEVAKGLEKDAASRQPAVKRLQQLDALQGQCDRARGGELAEAAAAAAELKDADVDEVEGAPALSALREGLRQAEDTLERRRVEVRAAVAQEGGQKVSPEKLAQIRETFEHFDTTRNGKLCIDEFEEGLRALGLAMSEAEAKQTFERFAADGEISLDSFVAFMLEVEEDTDSAQQVAAAFGSMRSGPKLTSRDLSPLGDDAAGFFLQELPPAGDGLDFASYIGAAFGCELEEPEFVPQQEKQERPARAAKPELADAAPGDQKERQRLSFVKWLNLELRRAGCEEQVEDPAELGKALRDGVMLMHLIHALSKVPMPARWNKKAKSDVACLDNLGLALDMVKAAGIKLVSIGPQDLLQGSDFHVLALLWAAIYTVRIGSISVGGGGKAKGKEGLLMWAQRQAKGYEGVSVTDFKGSWRDGLALSALVDKCGGGKSFDELRQMSDAKERIAACIAAAGELGVEDLIVPEDMLLGQDEKVVMAYIAEFFHVVSLRQQQGTAQRRVRKFFQTQVALRGLREDYERGAREVLDFAQESSRRCSAPPPSGSLGELREAARAAASFQECEFADKRAAARALERLHAQLQATLQCNQRPPYTAPDGLDPGSVAARWRELEQSCAAWAQGVREAYAKARSDALQRYCEAARKVTAAADALEARAGAGAGGDAAAERKELDALQAACDSLRGEAEAAGAQAAELEAGGVGELGAGGAPAAAELGDAVRRAEAAVGRRRVAAKARLAEDSGEGVSGEKLAEIQEVFQHFDTDGDGRLAQGEFAEALQGLGLVMSEGEAAEAFNRQRGSGGGGLTRQQFVKAVLAVEQDSDSRDQLAAAFRSVGGEGGVVTPVHLQQAVGSDAADYFAAQIPKARDGEALDYSRYLAAVFGG